MARLNATPTRSRWRLVTGIGSVTVIAMAVVGCQTSNHPTSDCGTARLMIDYNNEFNEDVRERTDEQVETSVDDYKRWASRLQELADQIKDDAALAERADELADLAGQTSALIPRYRAESSAMSPLDPSPPASVSEYSRIGQEFQESLVELDHACPI